MKCESDVLGDISKRAERNIYEVGREFYSSDKRMIRVLRLKIIRKHWTY